MVQVNNEQRVSEQIVKKDGFRLERMEVFNWGTFNQHIWTITPAGGTSLLTGANGSGKSTLVDALLTLLVPYHRRAYNLASGSEKQRERDERSYILGAWGKQKDLENNRSKPQYLRQANTYSVLLAVFINQRLSQTVTLAQILWLEDGVHKLYIVACEPLSIDNHFRLRGSPTDFRRQLKALGVEVFGEFSQYSKRFRQLMNFRSEKALDLFNQIASIKEIGGLNSFVRDHMLEKTDAQTRIRQLQDNFDNLTRAHDAIQLAEHQMGILEPLMQDAERHAEQQLRIAETNHSAELLSIYIASHRKALLDQAIQDAKQTLEQQKAQRATLQETLDTHQQHVVDLRVALNNDSKGQQIEHLKREIERNQRLQEDRTRDAKKYNRLAEQAGLFSYEDEKTFYANRRQAQTIQQDIEHRLEELIQQRDHYIREKGRVEQQYKELHVELTSLSKRSSQIPSEDIALRQKMLERLQLEAKEIPFVGELLRVRNSEQQWEPAIERLLHNFGRQLLVAEEHYLDVSQYVNNTNLQGRLVYHRINSSRTPRYPFRIAPRSLYHKLEVKPDTSFTTWLSAELMDSFNYICCESLEEFQRTHRALTRQGQIKHGQARHEKDDRYPLGDRRRYVLGWSNKEKQEAIKQEVVRLQGTLQKSANTICQIEQQQKAESNRLSALQSLLDMDIFETIDWRAIERRIQAQHQQLQQLEAESTHLAALRSQLEIAKKQVDSSQKEKDRLTGNISRFETIISSHIQERQYAERLLVNDILTREAATLSRIEKDVKDVQEREKGQTLTLSMLEDVRDRMRQFYQNRATSLQSQLRQTEERIVNRMRDFLNTNTALVQEMDATLDALGEYRRIYEQIKREDLPRHRKRFKELLNEKVITDIGSFKAALEKQEDEIRVSIQRLNASLSSIDYTDSTYICLTTERSHDTGVREFWDTLRSCLPDVAQARTPEANEISFQRIRQLLVRFNEEPYWTAKVTDVRNWLDFSASERYREDNTEKNYYSDSSGKSGGQKAKLAYTILASAIAYQYGLDQEEGRERTFRFVAVDEAFSKSDERNARYAMELFQQLDLQLLVVTPLDKIHVAERYISACHFVTNSEEENNSCVYNLTLAEYLTHKQSFQAGQQL